MSSNDTHHDWLSLIEISGPFLAVPVLKEAFPQGLEELDGFKRKRLRQAYDEWREALDTGDPEFTNIHAAWIEEVLSRGLELDEDGKGDVLKRKDWCESNLSTQLPEHGVTVTPDFAVVDEQNGNRASMLIHVYPQDADLEATSDQNGWAATPAERMVQLCRARSCRLGLVTNGERWVLVDAPVGAVTTFASWYARIWGQEPAALQAFVHLLGIRRFFVDETEQLPALLDRSLKFQDEVTDALGEQVRRAVEVLIQALDKADQDRGRELLRDVKEAELYEAALTVMMRLVFLLSAEERGLLLLGDEKYEAHYAVSTLRMQLRAESEEILERRWDAWSRLLAIFRAVFGGIEHENLRLPALGGSLFDPDRFPFLEGRSKGSSWRIDDAKPLPIDNRTVLLLLEAIQQYQGRTLSYRALDVEQIGYVYEGLLERTVKRTSEVTLELDATKGAKSPWVTLARLEAARDEGNEALAEVLREHTGSSPSRIRNDLAKPVDAAHADRLLATCHGDTELRDRIRPYAHLIRSDSWGYPLVYTAGAFIVTTGSDRRETGTHYTPKSLTEAIVSETLTLVAYVGPAEGKPREQWQLKSPDELLDLKVCDPAMGSGAFLVQACRWLAERLVEAWTQAEKSGKSVSVDGEVLNSVSDREPLPRDIEARTVIARRLIAERCLYGVDLNPLAVELAKLSIWLITLAKGRPFGFLDHNLRCGDSLLGIHRLDQLTEFSMTPTGKGQQRLFGQEIERAVREAIELRSSLRQMPIRDIRDVEVMAHLDSDARHRLEVPECIADALVGEVLIADGKNPNTAALSVEAGKAIADQADTVASMKRRTKAGLAKDVEDGKQARRPFHWPLEFPEVFSEPRNGFDAIVGNPPFLGGQKITGAMGTAFREYLVEQLAGGTRGSADLVSYFFLTAFSLLAKDGLFGLLAVNTIAEGNTREIGLDRILAQGGVIVAAYPSEVWPGTANVVTSRVHLVNGEWSGVRTLAGKPVSRVSSYLGTSESWGPVKLKANLGLVFQGSITLGEGFLVDEDFAKAAIAEDPDYRKIIYPYLIGREVNQSPEHLPGRLVINFFDWSEEKAARFPLAYDKVVRDVKPEREKQKDKGARRQWWLHLRPRPELYHATGRGALFASHPSGWKPGSVKFERVIVFATGATKYPCFTLVPNEYICANTVCVVASDSYALFACLSSDLHVVWAWEHGSKMKQDLRYTHGDIFETFPFPEGVLSNDASKLATLGERFFDARREFMVENDKGMTKFYNDFHDPDCNDAAIATCRDLQARINDAVLAAYHINDFNLDIDFHEVSYLPENKRTRFTISEPARTEILWQLAELNRQRYEEEVAQGLHSKKASKAKRKPRSQSTTKAPERQPSFEFNAIPANEGEYFQAAEAPADYRVDPASTIVEYLKAHPGWYAKSDILTATGISDGQWNASIAELIANGKVERQGERRGTRYRFLEGGEI
ncbi:hypothetical protein Y5W_01040 [Alcanivorax sp. 521-1]|uniref:site-specific DNA-methyltransferase (adenine-specific) n=1 Tax=Alloalcanivorax profundimaris TaxID=2735259 RepID=A0ABS0AQI0_9GAMM|nr:type IIL restriction-modification enzyme MmeI [Alloalcanivorax profundimaris]MBF5055746.1 hypothetical protein [Alloalcanivorax profundimaris]